jgi:hypothetical protein
MARESQESRRIRLTIPDLEAGKNATPWLLEVRGQATRYLELLGCEADPRYTAIAAWINERLQEQTGGEIRKTCAHCGMITAYSVAVLQARPALSPSCPSCRALFEDLL